MPAPLYPVTTKLATTTPKLHLALSPVTCSQTLMLKSIKLGSRSAQAGNDWPQITKSSQVMYSTAQGAQDIPDALPAESRTLPKTPKKLTITFKNYQPNIGIKRCSCTGPKKVATYRRNLPPKRTPTHPGLEAKGKKLTLRFKIVDGELDTIVPATGKPTHTLKDGRWVRL